MAELSLTTEQNCKLIAWQQASTQLSELKEKELALRQELVDTVMDPEKAEGSQSFKLGNGWSLTAGRSIYYKVEKDAIEPLLELLPTDIGDTLIKWKPDVSVTAYKNALPAYRNALPADKQKQLTEALVAAITITPGSPTLKLNPPKEAK
jgi:hypothetical protein